MDYKGLSEFPYWVTVGDDCSNEMYDHVIDVCETLKEAVRFARRMSRRFSYADYIAVYKYEQLDKLPLYKIPTKK